MSSSATLVEPEKTARSVQPSAPASASFAEIQVRSSLDASVAGPVLFLFASALLWLVGWSVVHLITTWKLLSPDFLASYSFLTYGRLRPIATNIFVYGWASTAGFGVALWLTARLSRVRLPSVIPVILGTIIWNTGLTAGIVALHFGASRSHDYLELPAWSLWILFSGFAVIGYSILGLHFKRAEKGIFITQAYVVAAVIWFAWTLLAGNLLTSLPWVQGVILAINNAWFVAGLTNYWFTALALGAIYYFIPKVTGRPIYSSYLATIGFWSFAFLAGFGGLQRFNGGPIPAWLITINIFATALTIIPAMIVSLNYHKTFTGSHGLLHYSPTLRFSVAGAMAYAISAATALILSFRSVAGQAGLSYANVAQSHFVLYAFYSFVIFGAIYFIVPRLVAREWVSSRLIRYHFLTTIYGIGATLVFLAIAGLFQGKEWANVNIPNDVVNQVVALAGYSPLYGVLLGGILLLFGHLIFAFHYLLMTLRLGQVSDEPTLLASPYAEEAH